VSGHTVRMAISYTGGDDRQAAARSAEELARAIQNLGIEHGIPDFEVRPVTMDGNDWPDYDNCLCQTPLDCELHPNHDAGLEIFKPKVIRHARRR